jgi:DNA-binding XRE family transcriptional regulator
VPKGSRCWRYYQEDLEELFGVSRKTLYTWEKDGRFRRGNLRSVINLYLQLNIRRLEVMKEIWKDMG